MWHEALLVAGKDLRIERQSRVATNQVAPFAILILVVFAFALDPDTGLLKSAAAGLFWIAVLLSALLAVQRSVTIETADGNREALLMAGLDPISIFLGKAGAIFVQLTALEVLLGLGIAVLYGPELTDPLLAVLVVVVATVGLSAAGTVYGVLAAGLRVRETLLPLLLVPVVAPVLIGATQSFDVALGGQRTDVSEWDWFALLVVFAVVYVGAGIAAFATLLEDR